jgi:hypothetical protein
VVVNDGRMVRVFMVEGVDLLLDLVRDLLLCFLVCKDLIIPWIFIYGGDIAYFLVIWVCGRWVIDWVNILLRVYQG